MDEIIVILWIIVHYFELIQIVWIERWCQIMTNVYIWICLTVISQNLVISLPTEEPSAHIKHVNIPKSNGWHLDSNSGTGWGYQDPRTCYVIVRYLFDLVWNRFEPNRSINVIIYWFILVTMDNKNADFAPSCRFSFQWAVLYGYNWYSVILYYGMWSLNSNSKLIAVLSPHDTKKRGYNTTITFHIWTEPCLYALAKIYLLNISHACR